MELTPKQLELLQIWYSTRRFDNDFHGRVHGNLRTKLHEKRYIRYYQRRVKGGGTVTQMEWTPAGLKFARSALMGAGK